MTRSESISDFTASDVRETSQIAQNRDLGSFRDDLAALLVDREEQARLDSLFITEYERVQRDVKRKVRR
jgi:hypothetical protein